MFWSDSLVILAPMELVVEVWLGVFISRKHPLSLPFRVSGFCFFFVVLFLGLLGCVGAVVVLPAERDN